MNLVISVLSPSFFCFFPKQFTVGFTHKKQEVCTRVRASQLGVAWACVAGRGLGVGVAWVWRGRGLGVACVAWAWLGNGVGVVGGVGAAWAWWVAWVWLGVEMAWAWRGVGVALYRDSDCERCVLVTKSAGQIPILLNV